MAGSSLLRFSRLTLEDQYALDQLSTRFEKRLLAGEEPRLEEVLAAIPQTIGEARDTLTARTPSVLT